MRISSIQLRSAFQTVVSPSLSTHTSHRALQNAQDQRPEKIGAWGSGLRRPDPRSAPRLTLSVPELGRGTASSEAGAARRRPQRRPRRKRAVIRSRGSPGRRSSGLGTRHHAPGAGGASLTSCSFRCKMTTPLPRPCRALWETRLGSGSGPGPGSPAAARPGLASPPEAPDLRIFALVAVELSSFAPGQKAPAGPWCPGRRLCGGRRRRWRRLGLLVVHDQRAGAAGCRLHLGCSTPPAQFADCSRAAILA